MNSATRKKLRLLAEQRLAATANDDEQWSFIFNTAGAESWLYCPYSAFEDWEFDGKTEGLDLKWAPRRLELIRSGKAEPNAKELRQWRRAQCQWAAQGTDWCWVAWMVPLWIDDSIRGWAAYLVRPNEEPDDPPALFGIYPSLIEGKRALARNGAFEEQKADLGRFGRDL